MKTGLLLVLERLDKEAKDRSAVLTVGPMDVNEVPELPKVGQEIRWSLTKEGPAASTWVVRTLVLTEHCQAVRAGLIETFEDWICTNRKPMLSFVFEVDSLTEYVQTTTATVEAWMKRNPKGKAWWYDEPKQMQ